MTERVLLFEFRSKVFAPGFIEYMPLFRQGISVVGTSSSAKGTGSASPYTTCATGSRNVPTEATRPSSWSALPSQVRCRTIPRSLRGLMPAFFQALHDPKMMSRLRRCLQRLCRVRRRWSTSWRAPLSTTPRRDGSRIHPDTLPAMVGTGTAPGLGKTITLFLMQARSRTRKRLTFLRTRRN